MEKWEYIKLISGRGSAYGTNGGVLDLLEWCKKTNTSQVTLEEAREFWEMYSEQRADTQDKAPAAKDAVSLENC